MKIARRIFLRLVPSFIFGAACIAAFPSWAADEATPDVQTPAAVPPIGPLVVRVGHAGPMTGGIAHLGRDNENGAKLAVEDLNRRGVIVGGQKILLELVAVNDAADPKVASQAALSLVERGVVGVVGHLNSGTSIPASTIYSRAGIPQISPSATNPRYTRNGYKTTFRIMIDDEDLGKSLGLYAMNEMGAKRIAIVDDRTAYGQGIANYFAESVKAKGGSVITRETISDRDVDFQALVERLKPQAPDLIFFGGMDATAGYFIRELNAQAMTPSVMGGDGICSNELARLAGRSVMDSIKVVCAEAGGVQKDRYPGMNDFYRRFKARFDEDVKVYAPYTYDAMQVLVRAMEQAGSVDPKVFLPVLAQTSGYAGVTGDISFDGKGDIRRGAYTVYGYRDMKRTQLEVRLGE